MFRFSRPLEVLRQLFARREAPAKALPAPVRPTVPARAGLEGRCYVLDVRESASQNGRGSEISMTARIPLERLEAVRMELDFRIQRILQEAMKESPALTPSSTLMVLGVKVEASEPVRLLH